MHDRWEHGSDFHLSLETGTAEYPWSRVPHTLWGSGRDALRALLAWLRERHAITRLQSPSYLCQKVVAALKQELPVTAYAHAPTEPGAEVAARRGDAVLVVNTFGMASAPRVVTDAVVIEDHTHDLAGERARASRAHYAVASLRKTLPLPDGGVLWSPQRLPLPAEVEMTSAHASAALARLSAMTLKLSYLSGHAVAKDDYRRLAVDGEERIGHGAVSGISGFSRARLPTFPVREWNEQRAANLRAFREALGEAPGIELLHAPFAATLVFDSADLRDRAVTALIAARIYPAILWPLDECVVEGIPDRHVDLSRRILTLHGDHRYQPSDMARVAEAVRKLAK